MRIQNDVVCGKASPEAAASMKQALRNQDSTQAKPATASTQIARPSEEEARDALKNRLFALIGSTFPGGRMPDSVKDGLITKLPEWAIGIIIEKLGKQYAPSASSMWAKEFDAEYPECNRSISTDTYLSDLMARKLPGILPSAGRCKY
jgi:hypothetical protein